MTCIVGLVDAGTVYIGADSAGIGGWDLTPRLDPKVFVRGPYVVGFTTSFRMGQIVRYVAELPDPPDDQNDLMRHMVVDFVGAVRKASKAEGYTKVDNNREEGGQFLVGVRGRLFMVDHDYQVGESCAGFDALGCGAQYAMGSMASTRRRGRSRALQALQVAERFSAGVRGPFNVERVG